MLRIYWSQAFHGHRRAVKGVPSLPCGSRCTTFLKNNGLLSRGYTVSASEVSKSEQIELKKRRQQRKQAGKADLKPVNEKQNFANRKKKIQELGDEKAYPDIGSVRRWFHELHSQSAMKDHPIEIIRVPAFRAAYENYKFSNESLDIPDKYYILEGRVSRLRRAGKGMIFLDIVQDFHKVQVVAAHGRMGLDKSQFDELHRIVKRGDQISVCGVPGSTRLGELSLKCSYPIRVASPILHPLPFQLADETKARHNRIVDYLINKTREYIKMRSQLIGSLRNYLSDRDFTEVQTPIISGGNTGANATPFDTTSKVLKEDLPVSALIHECSDSATSEASDKERGLPLSLRVAPELWLKRLVISGFDKVFEIGPVFRNEGIDHTHNPEFTTCEFYQSFIDLQQLMHMTEEIFYTVYTRLASKFPEQIDASAAQLLADCLTESRDGFRFQRVEFIPTIEKITGERFPDAADRKALEEFVGKLVGRKMLKEFQGTERQHYSALSSAQLLDKLSAELLEPYCGDSPTFIYHQPELLSPLAKSTVIEYPSQGNEKPVKHRISKRFELFIRGKEYVNAYEEENSPFAQEAKFKQQAKNKEEYADDEAIVPDYNYVDALEWALPPTGGWGIGIDRCCMFFCGADKIEQVLSFGDLRNVIRQ